MIRVKRVYEPPAPSDGYRVLVDRLWPRGLSKTAARIDRWMQDIAPSTDLRKWFGHDPDSWQQFKSRYTSELSNRADLLDELQELDVEHGTLTLVYAARDVHHSNGVALREVLQERSNTDDARGDG